MATNNRPLPRNTVAKKRLAPADPVPEHPMNHKKAMPANGTRFSAIATAESGFIGGPIFPALFIGGTAGVAVHQIFPSVPLGLAFTCLFAAVPGGVVSAPFSVVLLAAFVTQVGAPQTAPILIAVVSAFLTMECVKYLRASRKQAHAAAAKPAASA